MDLRLRDRVYLVTGGTSGLGRAGAAELVAEGARVVVSSRDPEKVDAAVRELGGEHVAHGVVADNADPATADRLVAAARTTFGRVDGALISVGGPPPTTALDATDEQWRAAFESVFLGAVRICRAVAGAVADGSDTALVLVLSSTVKSPIGALGISNGLRPGLGMLVKDLADALGPRGVRVNGVLPGLVLTDRVRQTQPDPEQRARSAEGIPLRRLGEPAELGRVAAFLLSPAASYVTGSLVPVDGGALRAL